MLDPNPIQQAQFGPIQGEAGETVTEIVLVVEDKGGIEGVFVDADGIGLLDVPVEVTAPGFDEDDIQTLHIQTDSADGHFTVVHALLLAHYPEITFSATINGTLLQGNFRNVDVIEESIVDLGVIPLVVVPEEATSVPTH